MTIQSIDKFREYLENQNDDFLLDGRRIEGIIRDIFPEGKSLISLLTTAWKAGVVAELRQSNNIEVTIAQFGDRLSQEYGFKESSALVAVRVWAYALGFTDVVPNINVSSTPSPSFRSQSSIPPETKNCPFCAEEVKKDARKCKHCHSDISDEKTQLNSGANLDRSSTRECGRDGRFIAYDNETVLDTSTNLMWAAKDIGSDGSHNGGNINWRDAKKYCDNYRRGGYTDWRMPTQDELAELRASGNYENLIAVEFWVWASETRGSKAASFHFDYGGRPWTDQSYDYDGRALPVRQHNELVDGKKKLAKGVRSSLPTARETDKDGRFIAYDNETVLDTSTNLMWAAKDNGEEIDWQSAKAYCDNYRRGGYTDWRMPTQDELAGLHASGNYENVIACGDFVWASETRGSEAANFYFGTGYRDWYDRSYDESYRALPVRSGK